MDQCPEWTHQVHSSATQRSQHFVVQARDEDRNLERFRSSVVVEATIPTYYVASQPKNRAGVGGATEDRGSSGARGFGRCVRGVVVHPRHPNRRMMSSFEETPTKRNRRTFDQSFKLEVVNTIKNRHDFAITKQTIHTSQTQAPIP